MNRYMWYKGLSTNEEVIKRNKLYILVMRCLIVFCALMIIFGLVTLIFHHNMVGLVLVCILIFAIILYAVQIIRYQNRISEIDCQEIMYKKKVK